MESANYPALQPGYYSANPGYTPMPQHDGPSAPAPEMEITEPALVMELKIKAWASEVLNKKDPVMYRETFESHQEKLQSQHSVKRTENKHKTHLPPVTINAFFNIFRTTTVVHVPGHRQAHNQQSRETSEKKDDTAEKAVLFFMAVVVLVASTAMSGFFMSAFGNVNSRIRDVQDAKKQLKNSDRQDKPLIKTFDKALEMLNASKSAIKWKLGISGGLFFSAVPLTVGAYISAPAVIGLGVLGMVSTTVAFTFRTAYTWDTMETKKGPGWMNWFPLNWVPKAEVKAAREILGIKD